MNVFMGNVLALYHFMVVFLDVFTQLNVCHS
jgi:hypothetical protein